METNKYTILFLNSAQTFERVYEAILENPFSDISGIGFKPELKETDRIFASFVERVERKLFIVDPFGKEIEQTIADYREVKFWILNRGDFFILALENAPQTRKPFFRFLTSKIDPLMSIDHARFDVIDILEKTKAATSANTVVIDRAKFSKVLISRHSAGKLEIVSDKNAVEDAQSLIGNAKYELDKISFILKNSSGKRRFSVSNTGQMEASEEDFFLTSSLINPPK